MLKFGNKEFRNLQEQVEKNMQDILFILQEEGVLNEFGIKVVGQEESTASMPTVTEYKEEHEDWSYGDTYAIGTTQPYTLYVLTRANGTHPTDYWFNIGSFPAPGPQGETGPQGPVGPQGQTGNPGTDGASAGFGTITATAQTLVPGSSATATVVASGPDTSKSFAFTFGIPRGEDGSSGGVWGDITGNIQDQTDLVNALQAKQDTLVSGTNIKTISGNSILGSGNIDISKLQATATIVIDALTNLNGRIISSFEATLDTSTSHTFYVITKGGNQLTEEQARDYMEYMTGSRFLPVYDYETPENSIFIFANGSLWKPQYDLFGLKLYALPNPYASKVDLTNYVDLSSTQRISGNKNFSKAISITDSYMPVGYLLPSSTPLDVVNGLAINKNGFSVTGQNNGDSHTNITYNLPPYSGTGTKNYTIATTDEIPDAVSGTNDGTNWTSLTIGSATYGIGGGSAPSNMVTTDTAQTITGAKTFGNNILPSTDGTLSLGNYSSKWQNLYLSGSIIWGSSYIQQQDNNIVINPAGTSVVAKMDNTKDLGAISKRWSDLYLAGSLKDGTNSITVANIANKNNFITLTQAEYDALATKDPNTYYFIEEE